MSDQPIDRQTVLPGPWPRRLTEEEVRTIASRARRRVADAIEGDLGGIVFRLGDVYRVVYAVRCGTPAELDEEQRGRCGATPEHGPPCHLEAGHGGPHCSVIKWG